MEFFRISRTIPFMRHALVLNLISFITFGLAVFFIATKGFNASVEFTGGTVMELEFSAPPNIDEIRGVVGSMKNETTNALLYPNAVVQNFGEPTHVIIRLPLVENINTSDQTISVMNALSPLDSKIELRDAQFVGPQVDDELTRGGIMAMLFVIVGIIIYLSFRFEWKFAVAGVIANLHDVVIIMGFFAFFEWEFSLSVLAAILAVLGYSVNESVVIMDRIRENFIKSRKSDVQEVINSAITATISRTIITHGSTQMVVLSMFFFGGPTLHNFSLALTIGIWFGIYSSVFVAASLAMWLGVKREDLVKPVKKVEDEQAELML